MDHKLVDAALHYRFLVAFSMLVVALWGLFEVFRLPVDAFPDISPIMVPVFAEAHGMAPEEVERLIAVPIESAMNGLPGVSHVKSTSAAGLAAVYVYFNDDVDIYFARQLVSERLTQAMSELPPLHEPPKLGPIATGLGQVFMYYLTLDEHANTGGIDPGMYLRDLNDWVVKYHLRAVPGVTDILSIGGHVLLYDIIVDPRALHTYGLALPDVVEAVRANNRNAGGQFMLIGHEEYTIRGIGLLQTLDDLRAVQVAVRNDMPVSIGDVAQVKYGRELRRGVVSRNGREEIVSGIVLQLFGANTSRTIAALYDTLPRVQAALPPGVRLVAYYEQADLVRKAVTTVTSALWQGALLVIIVLAFFLGSLRPAFVVTLALPFSALVAVLGMRLSGLSANLMSLGGLAIGIGMLGDGSIVMVENIARHLSHGEASARRSRYDVILSAAREVSRSIIFSTAIIVAVFLPIFTLQGVEGKLFSPLAFTLSFALAGSVLMAVVVAPALCTWLLYGSIRRDFIVLRIIKRLYVRPLRWAICHPRFVVAVVLATLAGAAAVLPRLGTEFIPTLDEGSILIGVTMAPSIALDKAVETVQLLERKTLAFAEIKEVVSRIGRPEAGSHPHPVNTAEMHLNLTPRSSWHRFSSKSALIEALRHALADVPGVSLNFTQPIQNAFDELLSGIKAQLAIKVVGEDLDVLRTTAHRIAAEINGVPGLVDISVEHSFGQPQLQIIADRPACARLGVTVDDILELVERAIGGEVIDTLYLNTRRYGIRVRYQEHFRSSPELVRTLLVPTRTGAVVPLGQVARVTEVTGPVQINREHSQRRWVVSANIRGRDLGGVIADIQTRIAARVTLPPGYLVEYGGQFENQRRAMRRLAIIVPVVLLLVFTGLCTALGSWRGAVLIMLSVPLAMVGGIAGLWLAGEYLSVPASVGFIALFGIAVQNGLVLVSCFNGLCQRGHSVSHAIICGALQRLRPVLMTALTTIVGLAPLVAATGIGAEVQRPLAITVICGLTTATLLTLFVIPALYPWCAPRQPRDLTS